MVLIACWLFRQYCEMNSGFSAVTSFIRTFTLCTEELTVAPHNVLAAFSFHVFASSVDMFQATET